MSLSGSQTHSYRCGVFDPSGRYLITGGGHSVTKNHRSITETELIAWNVADGTVSWQVVCPTKDGIADLAIRPTGTELASKCSDAITIWSAQGEALRTFKGDFLAGPLVYSRDGRQLMAPKGQALKILDADNGQVVQRVPLTDHDYTSAACAAFVPDSPQVLVAASVISSKGQVSGLLTLVDYAQQRVIKSSKLDVAPNLLAIDPHGHWACVAGKRRGRGCIVFWDLDAWKQRADQGAHGGGIDELAVSPDGKYLASIGADLVGRIWDTSTGKTIAKLEQHRADSASIASIAWSPAGRHIAVVCPGAPPHGGVFLYEGEAKEWQLKSFANDDKASSEGPSKDLRPVQVYGSDIKMDTVGDMSLPANEWPIGCERCRLPDLSAVPQPYYLIRGLQSTADFAGAMLGNFLVRAAGRRLLEIAAPDACRFYPTHNAKTKEPTEWFLAVPQTQTLTRHWPEKYKKCPQCGAPKFINDAEPFAFAPPPVEVFKSQQWTAYGVGEESKWYLEKHLRMTKEQVPAGQWTRLGLNRELWFSTRLLLLIRKQKLQAPSFLSSLDHRKPLPAEAEWIAQQSEHLASTEAATAPALRTTARTDDAQWFREYLQAKSSTKPLATAATIAAWEKKHGITFPASYKAFVTTVGRHSFADMFGIEGFDVRIVGPKQCDATSYRRDPEEGANGDGEPDGLMFAVAINGDVLCFDVRDPARDFAVYHFNHETEQFESFAPTFAAAVRRLVERT